MIETSLEGQRAAVIGADHPAGAAIARALAGAGADVALCALTADEAVMRARAVRRQIEAMGRRAPEYIMDVTLGKNVQVTTRQIAKEMGGLDIVVSAPELFLAAPIESTTDTDLARVMQVNFNAHFFAIRTAAGEFRRQQVPGRILLVTSTLGQQGGAHAAAFASAQGGVHTLVRAAARELEDRRIAVNGIALGWMEWMDDRAEVMAVEDSRGSLDGRGQADEVGAAALALLGGGVTGRIVTVPGGQA